MASRSRSVVAALCRPACGVALFATLCVAGCAGKSQNEDVRVPAGPLSDVRPVFEEAKAAPEPVLVSSGAEPVVSLRTPHARAEATHLLAQYVRAIVRESNLELSQLLTEDATIRYGTQTQGSSALASWVRRFSQRDYTGENVVGLYDPAQIEVYGARDTGSHSGQDGFAFSPEGTELVLRVPLSPSNPSGRFGDELQLLLVPTRDGLLIQRIFERGYADP